mmetsp:Transcript_81022/g.194370  ORF Transcript_81022/g.194370 Transcript_81022/m.194370 type:complete len:305 (+) Transcript_81022:84-998(+)
MVARSLEMRHHHIPRSQLGDLGVPVPDPLRDPSLGYVLLDAVIKVQLHLQERRAHHGGDVRIAAFLAPASLEVGLHSVAHCPFAKPHDPAQWHRLLDGVLELDLDASVHWLREDDAYVRRCAAPAVVPHLEVHVGHAAYLDLDVPGSSPVAHPGLGHVLLDVVIENYVNILLAHRQHGTHVGLDALCAPPIVHFEERSHPVPRLEAHHLLNPAHRHGLDDLILKPDLQSAPVQDGHHNAQVSIHRPALARGVVSVDNVARREVQIPGGQPLRDPSLGDTLDRAVIEVNLNLRRGELQQGAHVRG